MKPKKFKYPWEPDSDDEPTTDASFPLGKGAPQDKEFGAEPIDKKTPSKAAPDLKLKDKPSTTTPKDEKVSRFDCIMSKLREKHEISIYDIHLNLFLMTFISTYN